MRKRCGTAIRLLTATALIATMSAQSVAARAAGSTSPFSDVHPEDWFYPAVDDLTKRGIVVGSEGRFHPNDPVTRAEFTKMAVVALGYHYTVLQEKEPKQVFTSKEDAITYASQFDRAFVRDNYTGEVVWDNYPENSRAQLQEDSHYAHFSDVPYGVWYWSFVEGAWAAKVVKGVWPGQFAPDAQIQRQDMATLLMNALRVNGLDPGEDLLQPFGDRADLSPYAVTPVSMAVKLKIMSGDERQLLHPRDPATRAHAAAMIDQALQIPEGELRSWQTKTVKQLEIVPSALKLALGQRQKVLALALRDDGAMVPVGVNWRVNGSVGSVQGDQFVAASQAGTGSLVATLTTTDGRTLVAKIPVTVVAATPVQVELTATPSTSVFPGNKVRIQVTLRDPAGQLVPGEVDLDVSVSDPTKGSMDVTRKAVTGGIGDLGTFTAGPEPGTVRIRAEVVTDGWSGSGEITLNIVKVQNPVYGKGLWGTWVEWGTSGYDPDRIIQRAKDTGARYIYLIVRNQPGQGTIRAESKAMLDAILPRAHANQIAVIGCVYFVDDPNLDASRMLTVARYTTPTGDRVDGLAADIEESPTDASITATMETVRQALGYNYPVIAVTYPPHIGTAWERSAQYPWSTFGKYFNMISIMDYWHYRDKPYTAEEVRNEVLNEAKAAARLTGRPVEVIGQAYRMDLPNGAPFATVPTADEINAAMQAAKDAGAVAFSLYRWDTATQEELAAFRDFPW